MNSTKQPVIAFLGGGNMASSIIGGLVAAGWSATQVRVSDPSPEQRQSLEQRFDVQCFDNNGDCIDSADVVVLAVKPQILQSAVEPVATKLRQTNPLVISIVAGISSNDTLQWIGASLPFIRVMPNTPALVNKGVSGLYANEQVNTAQKELAQSLMEAVGTVIWVEHESLIDSVTGVSGSGPAYFFKMMELMMAEGIAQGLSPDAARTLVVETALGAATLIRQSPLTPEELRRQVTSPGGTTAAGITAMEKNNIDKAVRDGVKAAVVRSAELAQEFGAN